LFEKNGENIYQFKIKVKTEILPNHINT